MATRSPLSLATLSAKLEELDTTSTTYITNYYATNLQGSTSTAYTMGDIYSAVQYSDTDISEVSEKLGLAINNNSSATIADMNTTYSSLYALAQRLETIDTLLDLSSIEVEGGSSLDSIKALSTWITEHEAEIDEVKTNYLDAGFIVTGSHTFTELTDDETNTALAYCEVTFSTAMEDTNYRVILVNIESSSAGSTGEYCVYDKTTTGFKVGFTGNPISRSFQYVAIHDGYNYTGVEA